MSLARVKVFITIPGDPSVGIFSHADNIELEWELDEDGERERVRDTLAGAWSELYDDKADVRFGDECPDCLGIKAHKPLCPSDNESVLSL